MVVTQRKKIVIANWKMNPENIGQAKKIYTHIKKDAKKFRKTDVVVCPPFLYISSLLEYLRGGVSVGAQDCFWEEAGSYTGEVSAQQLSKEGVSYCIVGHSERRALGEKNEDVQKKVQALLKANITPIICVGETERDRDGFYLAHIKDQIREALDKVKQKDLQRIIIAYEPIWAIGKKTSEAATGADIHEMSIYIRKVLTDIYTQRTAFKVAIIYGGSVDETNAAELLSEGEIDGFLVGRASLNATQFLNIITSVNSA